MTLFLPHFQQGFSPLFRLADEIERASRSSSGCAQAAGARSQRRSSGPVFLPRFDVKETKEAYHLTGELPGVDQSNINVEWADQKTLVISGSTESQTNVPEQAEPVAAAASEEKDSATSETESAHYRKPSVEDDSQDFVDVEKPGSESSETAEAGEPAAAPVASKKQQQEPVDTGRYLFTERATGSFKRVFKFPGYVDHENVQASLKNGVLAITAPKAKPVEPRRIVIS